MSDNELDAELLALAGDDSSDDERPDNRQTQPSSPFEHAALSSEPDRSPPRRSLAQKSKSRSSAASRRRRKDDSEEEGEASAASSPRSLGSAAMDESDSEDGIDFDQDAPLYPIEGKFRSESDRAEVMAMTEIRREEILAERAAEVERRVQDLQLKKILQQRKREQAGADKRKRKAAAADLDDDDQRKSSRPKVKASGPLEAYKREREMKGQQRNREDDRRRDRSPSRDDVDSDRDAEGDSEVEWDEKPRAAAARDEAPATLRDFERARIGRTNFARVCFYPTFETSIRNCYARVSIGVNRDTGAPQYRMAQIKG
ncbi:plus-3-domain-containing protein, partial [Aureobasidium melanogenum]